MKTSSITLAASPSCRREQQCARDAAYIVDTLPGLQAIRARVLSSSGDVFHTAPQHVLHPGSAWQAGYFNRRVIRHRGLGCWNAISVCRTQVRVVCKTYIERCPGHLGKLDDALQ